MIFGSRARDSKAASGPTGREMSFVERHGLRSAAQKEAMKAVRDAVAAEKLETIRLSFADQHGVLRGKTLMAEEALEAFADGCMITTTMVLKDTSHRTVFPAFTPGGGLGMREMQGAAREFEQSVTSAASEVQAGVRSVERDLNEAAAGNASAAPAAEPASPTNAAAAPAAPTDQPPRQPTLPGFDKI